MASSMNRLSRVRPRQQRTQFTQKATCALDASKLPEAQNGFTLTDTPSALSMIQALMQIIRILPLT